MISVVLIFKYWLFIRLEKSHTRRALWCCINSVHDIFCFLWLGKGTAGAKQESREAGELSSFPGGFLFFLLLFFLLSLHELRLFTNGKFEHCIKLLLWLSNFSPVNSRSFINLCFVFSCKPSLYLIWFDLIWARSWRSRRLSPINCIGDKPRQEPPLHQSSSWLIMLTLA